MYIKNYIAQEEGLQSDYNVDINQLERHRGPHHNCGSKIAQKVDHTSRKMTFRSEL
jgi:hypothetical protein